MGIAVAASVTVWDTVFISYGACGHAQLWRLWLRRSRPPSGTRSTPSALTLPSGDGIAPGYSGVEVRARSLIFPARASSAALACCGTS